MRGLIFILSIFVVAPTFESDLNHIKFSKRESVNKTMIQKNIIIGDSQSPYVDWGSQSFNLISPTGGQSSLWLGGIGKYFI